MKKNTIQSEQKRKENTIHFINSTQKLINSEGVNNISIRKIATESGFHNSTIYLYFRDIDQLIMLASVKYFQDYSNKLEKVSKETNTPEESFFAVWRIYFRTIMNNPHIFHNFFFGKHSSDLTEIMNTYYEYFPEERRHFNYTIESMYYGENITVRSAFLLVPLADKNDNLVTSENLELLNEVMVSYCRYKLEMKLHDETVDTEVELKDFMYALSHLTGIPEQ